MARQDKELLIKYKPSGSWTEKFLNASYDDLVSYMRAVYGREIQLLVLNTSTNKFESKIITVDNALNLSGRIGLSYKLSENKFVLTDLTNFGEAIAGIIGEFDSLPVPSLPAATSYFGSCLFKRYDNAIDDTFTERLAIVGDFNTQSHTQKISVLKFEDNTWQTTGNTGYYFENAVPAYMDSWNDRLYLYIFGGSDSSKVYRYEYLSQTINELTISGYNYNMSGYYSSAVYVPNKNAIYLLTGAGGNPLQIGKLQVGGSSFSHINTYSNLLYSHFSAVVINNKIYIVGGQSSLSGVVSNKRVFEFNPDNDSLSALPDLDPTSEINYTGLVKTHASAINNRIYIVREHGSNAGSNRLEKIEEYDITKPQPSRIINLSPELIITAFGKRYAYRLQTINNKILLFGGIKDGFVYSTFYEIK